MKNSGLTWNVHDETPLLISLSEYLLGSNGRNNNNKKKPVSYMFLFLGLISGGLSTVVYSSELAFQTAVFY